MTVTEQSDRTRRSGVRRAAATTVFVGAVTLHLTLLVMGGSDPHKRFGFRPFNESDVWQVEIVRVHADGTRWAVDDGTWVYDWDELVGAADMQRLTRAGDAPAGARAAIDLLERALRWAVDHIPDDPETIALEATVTTFHNARGPETTVLVVERGADG